MEHGKYASTIGKWWYNIAGFVQISATAATLTGPAGWATAAGVIGTTALYNRFAAWTSVAYATYGRLGYSQNAAKELQNARVIVIGNSGTYFPRGTFTTVSGY
ncbi:hypothetical protein ACOI1C_18475 [Bacillus sp. DJP31]|uniref:hypothetical protein n=1 Tax=Bacillus sp. DJP31 TaxID=3409789 RepID=UPI003BB69628